MTHMESHVLRLTAAAIVEQNGRFLLVEERGAGGQAVLNSPSGRWEFGESLAATATREAAEEASIIFVPEFLLGSYITTRTTHSDQRITVVQFAFGGRISPGTPAVALDPAILGIHWLTAKETLARRAQHRSPAVMRCIEDFMAGHRYPLDAINEMGDRT